MSESILDEKWVKGIAITTTVLAVVAAIAGSRSSYFVAKAQLLTALEGSQWNYYQAKSIKEDLFDTQQKAFQSDMQGATTAGQRDFLNKTINDYTKSIARYDQEKALIQKQAQDTNKENTLIVKRGGQFSLAVVFAQIGIMLSSVGALLKRKEIWIVGLVIGFISLIFLANGFLLVF
jgi:hypothetical protein